MSLAPAHAGPGGFDAGRASPNRTLFILALGALAYTLAQTMIVPALPQIQRDLHTTAANVTWLLTAFLLASSITTPIVGRFGDMYGKERMLLFALVVFGLGNLIAAFGHTLPVYIVGRSVQGAGGAILPLAIGIIRDEFPREKVATGIGTISAMFGIGGGIGLVVSGLLVDGLGVDSIFWLGVIASVIAAIATWRFVPESPVRVQARIDYLGAALLTVTLVALLIGVSEGNSWGWTSAKVLGLFAAAIVFGVVWAWHELRTVDPLVDLRLMREKAMWTVNLSAFAIGFAMFGSYILIPQLVQAP
ncbi:MAG TPA: MFS transporter, partial [Solirubrobacteraceae bacterium]